MRKQSARCITVGAKIILEGELKITKPDRLSMVKVSVSINTLTLAKLNLIPGFKKFRGRDLYVRPTFANLEYLCNNFDVEWGECAAQIREEYMANKAKQEELKAKKLDIPEECKDHIFKRAPLKHQAKGFMLSRDEKLFAYFMEPGTGKTKLTLDVASWLYRKGKIDSLVVIAWPNGIQFVWEDEMEVDFPYDYEALPWTSDSTKRYAKKIEAFSKLERHVEVDGVPLPVFKIFPFNAEAFTSRRAKEAIINFLKTHRSMVAIDQSASIKNPKAVRTKFLVDEISPLCEYKRILEGSPSTEGAHELYSQFKFLDENIIGHDTWTAFRNEFCKIGIFDNVIGYQNLDELSRRIDPYIYRVRAEECQDIPPRVYRRWRFDLNNKERALYDELKKKSLVEFEGDTIEENLAMVKMLRLQQITSGWFAGDDFKPISDKPSRLAAVLSLLSSIEGKAIIFTRFRADLELLSDVLGDKAVSFYGGHSAEEKNEAKRRFQEDDDILYFIGQPRTAGIGHTLTAASHVIFYTNDGSLRFRGESEKRAHRQGQEKIVTIWDVVARKTQDSKIVQRLQEKEILSRVIMDDPDTFFLVEEDD